MLTIDCTIKGIAPYFYSKPTKNKTPKTRKQEEEYARAQVYQFSEGNGIYIPTRQIKGCMIHAIFVGKLKIERSSKRALELFRPTVFIEPEEIPFEPPKTMEEIELVELHTFVGNGLMRWCLFPMLRQPGWELNFQIKAGDFLEPEFIHQCLEIGGMLCGIGGKRPENGRFEVINWAVV